MQAKRRLNIGRRLCVRTGTAWDGLGPPRPQTPRQGTLYPGPVPAILGTQSKQLVSVCWVMAAGKLPGIRKQTGPTAKTNELVFGRPCCFPCALCAQAARQSRAARERRVASTVLAAIAAFPTIKYRLLWFSLRHPKRERPIAPSPRQIVSCRQRIAAGLSPGAPMIFSIQIISYHRPNLPAHWRKVPHRR